MNKLIAMLLIGSVIACEPSGREALRPPRAIAVVEAAEWDVRTVHLGELAKVPEWRLGDQAITVVQASESDPNFNFWNTGDVVALSDGRILVSSPSQPMRLFRQDGTLQTVIGRKGEGPGEFQQILRAARLLGDTIATYDNHLARVSIFTPDGRFVRSHNVEVPVRAAAFTMEGVLVGGRAAGNADVPSQPKTQRSRLRVIAVDPSRDDALQLGFVDDWVYHGGTSVPFSPRAAIAAGRQRIYVTASDRYVIDVYDRNGQVFRIQADAPLVRNDEDVEAWVNADVGPGDNPAAQQARREAAIYAMKHRNQIGGMRADDVDWLWVWHEGMWHIFDPAGKLQARLGNLGEKRWIISVSRDWAVVGRSGENGIEAFEVSPIVRP